MKSIIDVHSTVAANESKYSQANIDDVDMDEYGPPEHLWSYTAPSTEESRSQSLAEGNESLIEVSQEDLRDNANLMTSTTTASYMCGLKVLPIDKRSPLTNIGNYSES